MQLDEQRKPKTYLDIFKGIKLIPDEFLALSVKIFLSFRAKLPSLPLNYEYLISIVC